MPDAPLSKAIEQLRKIAFPPDGGELTDGKLLERFLAQHEEEAFEALVRRHGSMVLGVRNWSRREAV
jgi:hypothetical protein